nr:helix-turn-helix domain-containing protein [Mesorhizobium sp.]
MKLAANVPRIGLSRDELAAALGVSPNSVDKMVAEGMLPPARRWHTRRIWRVAEIDAFMSEWPIEATGQPSGPDSPAGDEWRAQA